MIDTEHWKARRESANWFFRFDELAHVAQVPVKGAIWARPSQTVEISE